MKFQTILVFCKYINENKLLFIVFLVQVVMSIGENINMSSFKTVLCYSLIVPIILGSPRVIRYMYKTHKY